MKSNWQFGLGIAVGLFFAATGGYFFRPRSPFSLSAENYRYRFDIVAAAVVPNAIPALEDRMLKRPSALDLAELASLYFERGHVTGDTGWFDKAEKSAKRSLELIPTPNPAMLTLAKIADARHQFSQAIEFADKAFKDKGAAAALGVLVTSHLAVGNLAEAARYADYGIELRPTLATYLMKALVAAAQGRDEEAQYAFRRAAAVEDLGNNDESARMRALWGRFLGRRGDYSTAEDLFTESLRISPGNHLALSLQGDMDLSRGRYGKAEKGYLAAFGASKQSRYLIRYARAKEALGQKQVAVDIRAEAENLLRKDLAAGSFGHRLELAELLFDRGEPANLKEAISLAQAELKVRQSAEANFVLARGLFAANRAEEAVAPIQAVLRTGVHDQDYYALAIQIENARHNDKRAEFLRRLGRSF